ncbi:MAG: branched-chain amino acid ABC transporter permease [Candidatus Bathyarchaeota archaeon]|nr:branched-chain amino acid ABC transporter permease [Candidatus Bathyarchaeota archaeon]
MLPLNLPQIFFNSIITGSIFMLAAIGLSLSYSLSRFPNFTHAEYITLGGYVGYLLSEQLGMPLYVAFIASFLGSSLLSLASYNVVFKPLQDRGSPLIYLMVASIGLGLVVRHTIQQIWGGSPLTIRAIWPRWILGHLTITGLYVYIITAAIVTAIALHLLLTRTTIGKCIRASADNVELALSSGMNVSSISRFVWLIGGGLAGLSGFFMVAIANAIPLLGWRLLIPAFAVTILGGIGSFYGVLIAAYIIGVAENFSVVGLAALGLPTDLKMLISFAVIVVVLLVKPEGISASIRGGVRV